MTDLEEPCLYASRGRSTHSALTPTSTMEFAANVEKMRSPRHRGWVRQVVAVHLGTIDSPSVVGKNCVGGIPNSFGESLS